MFGIFPDWVGDTLSLIAVVVGTPGLILWFLGRKDANRKLVVEEGGLTVEQFNAALPAYKDLLDRSNKERDAAIEREEALTKDFKAYRDETSATVADLKTGQQGLRRLVLKLIAQHEYQPTDEEREILEMTAPRKRTRPITRP